MGGTVAVTLRESNGNEHRMARWTNELPWFVNNDLFFENNQKHLGKYLFPGCDTVKASALAPEGYGLVVLDFKTKTILSCQNHSKFGKMPLAKIRLETFPNYHQSCEEEDMATAVTKRLFNKGMIKSYTRTDEDGADKDHPISSWREVETILAETSPFSPEWIVFNIAEHGWTIQDFERTSEGFMEMKSKVEKLGFELRISEQEKWARWIEKIKELEKEDT